MKPRKKAFPMLFILSILFFVMFCACGTQSMKIKVIRPAEVNLKKYAKVAIGDITNAKGRKDAHANDISDSITSALFETEYFEVLDRQNMQRIMDEHKLNLSGAVDADNLAELGRIIGTSALIFGRIQTDNYDEERSSSSWKDSKGKSHTTYTRKGAYTLNVSIKVVDMETARVVATKILKAAYKDRTSKTDERAPKIDKNALYASCLTSIKIQFKRLIAPYEKTVEAKFQTDSDLPETESALNQFKIGEWDTGISILENATLRQDLDAKVQAKAYYNLGLARTYTGQYDQGIENFKKAMMLNPKEDRYVNAVNFAKKEKAMADQLNKQQRD